MNVSSVQTVSPQYTADRTDTKTSETIQDRTRQDSVRQLARAVKVANESGQLPQNAELAIALDRGSGQTVIRLIDRNTHELIQQIPGERVLRMAEEFKQELAKHTPAGGTDWLSTLA